MHWGILPFFLKDFDDEDKAIKDATRIIKEKSLVKEGDVIIFTSGAPYTDKGRKSWIRFAVI